MKVHCNNSQQIANEISFAHLTIFLIFLLSGSMDTNGQDIGTLNVKPEPLTETIDYPFPSSGKSFLTVQKVPSVLSSKSDIVWSYDKKGGLWFIENSNVHYYNL